MLMLEIKRPRIMSSLAWSDDVLVGRQAWWRLTLPSSWTPLFSMLPHDILLVSHPTAGQNQFRIDSILRGHFGWHDQSIQPKELHFCKINIKFYRCFLTTLQWPVRVILGNMRPHQVLKIIPVPSTMPRMQAVPHTKLAVVGWTDFGFS